MGLRTEHWAQQIFAWAAGGGADTLTRETYLHVLRHRKPEDGGLLPTEDRAMVNQMWQSMAESTVPAEGLLVVPGLLVSTFQKDLNDRSIHGLLEQVRQMPDGPPLPPDVEATANPMAPYDQDHE